MGAIAAGATRSETDLRVAMAEEATRIERWARTWDTTYRTFAQRWSRWNSFLVALAALLAAGAGATGLGNVWTGSLGPGLLAAAAAVVSGIATALGASTRATQYNAAAASNSGLADAALAFRKTVVEYQLIADVSTRFEELCKRRDTVVNSAPVSGGPRKLTRTQLRAWPPQAQDRSPTGTNHAVAADRIVVLERGQEISFSFEDMLEYHGGGSPGGVAHAFKVMQRGLPVLGAASPLERRSIVIETAFGGPGARDAFELVTRAVSEQRLTVEPSLARPEHGRARERFVFRLGCGDRAVTLVLREGFVTDEFIDLTRRDKRNVDEDRRLETMKSDMAKRVMSAPAAAVYDVASSV